MNRTSMIAGLALSLIGLAACAGATPDRRPGAATTDGGPVGGLQVGAPADGAVIGRVPDDAIGAPDSGNRMHIGEPLPPAR